MSYILEALKKSDRERKQGKVPTLETVQDRSELRRHGIRPHWPIVLFGFLVLGGLSFSAWLYWPEPAPAPTASLKTSPPEAPSPADSTPTVDTTASRVLPTEETQKPGLLANQEQTAPEINPVKTTSSSPELTTPVTTTTSDNVPAAPPEVENQEPVTTDESAPGDQEERQSPPPIDQSNSGIVKFENLPTELKDELPEIKIGVHLYSENPDARRASINGRLLREGQLVEPGLHLEEITRQGAILSFRGRKFSVAVFPH